MNESAIIAASHAHPRPRDILYAYGTAGFRTTSVIILHVALGCR